MLTRLSHDTGIDLDYEPARQHKNPTLSFRLAHAIDRFLSRKQTTLYKKGGTA